MSFSLQLRKKVLNIREACVDEQTRKLHPIDLTRLLAC